MMAFGSHYGRSYDLLYRDKDYAGEAQYVLDLMAPHLRPKSSLLELGCGTGRYSERFSEKGHRVHGMDLSNEMLAIAKSRGLRDAEFTHGDASDFNLNAVFDGTVALFHVVNYLTTNEQLDGFFRSTSAHLREGGVLAFDFWYGPAVLSDAPSIRNRRVHDDAIEVDRTSTPTLCPNENVVEVRFDTVLHLRETGERLNAHEVHRMRYLFLPEIDNWLRLHGFDRVIAHRFMTRADLGVDSWHGIVVARKCG